MGFQVILLMHSLIEWNIYCIMKLTMCIVAVLHYNHIEVVLKTTYLSITTTRISISRKKSYTEIPLKALQGQSDLFFTNHS